MTDRPRVGRRWLERLGQASYDHLVRPFLASHDRLPRVALGASVGMFVGLTPTVGIQMYIVTVVWLISRYGFRIRFNLPLAISLVWISNPVTTVPIYFVFLETGDWALGLLGYPVIDMSLEVFRQQVADLGGGGNLHFMRWLFYATEVLLIQFGWPMVVGSLFYAVPLSVLSYPLTMVGLGRYRRFLARQQGISYPEWRERYETRR